MTQNRSVTMVLDVGSGVRDASYLEKILSMGRKAVKEGQVRVARVVHQPTCQLWHRQPPCTCQPSLKIVERDA